MNYSYALICAIIITTFLSFRLRAQENILYLDACENIVSEEDYTFKRIIKSDPNDKFSYLFEDYYRDGALYTKGIAKSRNGKTKSGEYTFYHPNGDVLAIGVINGLVTADNWQFWDEIGQKTEPFSLIKNFSEIAIQKDSGEAKGKCLCYFKHGVWNDITMFNPKGEVIIYNLGKEAFISKLDFKNGIHKFFKFISKKLEYPALASRLGNEGKVYVSMYVDRKGMIDNIKVLSAPYPWMSYEAERVVAIAHKKLIPIGLKSDEKLHVILPLNFKLR